MPIAQAVNHSEEHMLSQVISDIVQCQQTIEAHHFDETATKQYIVLPILRSLDWHDSNLYTLEVYPEKKVGSGQVDYALQQNQTSLVFIECKRWGASIEKYQEQICRYAFQAGIEIAVITNGKMWDFYLPNQTSTPDRRVVPWEDRIFCSIDLEVQQEAISDFEKYLSKSNVEMGIAKAEAQEAFQPQLSDTPSPRQHYGVPILIALRELGGSAETNQVLAKVYQIMDRDNLLRPTDKLPRSDGKFYWDNRTQDMRRELINKGLMMDDSPWGIWEISNAGQAYLRAIDVQNAPQSQSPDPPLRERCAGSSNMLPAEPQAIDTPLPRERYALPILNALVQLGGDATADAVLKKVRQLMETELQQIDLSHRPDGQVYWKNRCHDMRRELIRRGLMKDDSPQGIWEATHAGREYLSNNGRA